MMGLIQNDEVPGLHILNQLLCPVRPTHKMAGDNDAGFFVPVRPVNDTSRLLSH